MQKTSESNQLKPNIKMDLPGRNRVVIRVIIIAVQIQVGLVVPGRLCYKSIPRQG